MASNKEDVFFLYQKFINDLDDYFEYRGSILTRTEFRQKIERLHNDIRAIKVPAPANDKSKGEPDSTP